MTTENVETEQATNSNQSKAALKTAIGDIRKKFGKGSVLMLNQNAPVDKAPSISTGSFSLDYILGIGGLPRGRVVEIFGAESAGKSTLALSVIAQAQKQGGQVAYVDAEHALDPNYAETIGVDTENVLLSQPNSAEEALEIVQALVRSGGIDVVVVDSVAALVPQAEVEGQMGEYQIGSQARLMSQALRKLTAIIHKTSTVAIFINQLRQKVGVVYGNPEVTPGGQALKFYSSVRIDLRRKEAIKQGTETTGIRVKARVVKNKMAPPFRQTEFSVIYGKGLFREAEILDVGVELGVIKRSGASYSWGEEKLGSGKESAQDKLVESPELCDAISKAITEKMNG